LPGELPVLEYLHKRFGVNVISFFDNCFAANRKRVKEICEKILERNLKIYWICLTRVDNIVDSEILQIMRKAGCLGICFGIESGSPAILQNINKKCNIAQAKKAIQMTKKSGIKALTFYIVGNHGETDQTIRETIDFVKDAKADIISVECNVVFPGTALYEIAKRSGWIDDSYWDGNNFAPHFTCQHSYEQLTSYAAEIFFAHFSSRLASGDRSSLRCYFFTGSFSGYVMYKLKFKSLINFIRQLRGKKNTVQSV
jgi:anaerobic magnesium-protoporphyrin IX monomethyl ester cyclase